VSAPAPPETVSSPPSASIVSAPIVPIERVAVGGAGDRLAPAGRRSVGIVAGVEVGFGEVAGRGVLEDHERLPARAAGSAVLVPLQHGVGAVLLQPQEARAPNGFELPSQPSSRLSSDPSRPRSQLVAARAGVKSVTVSAAVPRSR
jgi:hypothetical protein